MKVVLKKAIIVQLSDLEALMLNGGDRDIIKMPDPGKTKYTCGVCGSAFLTCSPE